VSEQIALPLLPCSTSKLSIFQFKYNVEPYAAKCRSLKQTEKLAMEYLAILDLKKTIQFLNTIKAWRRTCAAGLPPSAEEAYLVLMGEDV
jgi:hypothetical protein